ncbi:MAG: type II toxin-antitoxin system RelE/ParE family toxin [Gammaproteobacteria bacterium]|nr:type II toxin-antitoxin system RelE/ParE family toxin [Gammaproteobacteria bacterium]
MARILDYGIDRFGLEQALAYYDTLQSRFDEIAEDPLRHPAVDHVRKGYRRSVCGSHSIYYRVDGQTVEIMRLLNREDIRKVLA